MNQFVPQLMLGNPCCNSTNAPLYQPQFTCPTAKWIIASQYFFEIKNTVTGNTEPHAATGDIFEVEVGEEIFTTFKMDAKGVWTLQIGVKGDDR